MPAPTALDAAAWKVWTVEQVALDRRGREAQAAAHPGQLTRLLTYTPATCSLADHTVEQICSLHRLALGRAPGARLLLLHAQDFGPGRPARSNLPLVGDVARTLVFAPAVRALADHIVASISGGGGFGGPARRAYNAVHLRLEKDARDWSHRMGGQAVRPLPAPRDAV